MALVSIRAYYQIMTTDQPQCPKCQGEMVQGFVPDFTKNAAFVLGWHEGQPQKSFWTRTKVSSLDGVPIGAFRCQKCGFLEFYSDPKFAAE
jgi:hypothetical protein